MALVGLKLCLTRSARTDTASETRQRRTHTSKSGQAVLLLCELYLELAFLCACTLSENIKYQRSAVYYANIEDILDIAHLHSA